MKSSLKNKLGIGFASVLGLMVVVGGIGGFAVTNLSHTAHDMAQVYSKLDQNAGDIIGHAQGARRFEKEFLIGFRQVGTAKAREKYGKAASAEIEQIKRLANESVAIARTDADRDRFRAVIRAAEAYEADFNTIMASVDKRGNVDTGAEGEFRNAVHAIESKLKASKDPDKLTIQMLSVRRAEKDYLLRTDEKYVQGTIASIDKLKQAIDQEPTLSVYDKSALKDLADKYQRAFNVLVEADRAVSGTLGAPDAASAELAKAAHAAEEAANAANEAALANVTDTSRTSLLLVAIVSLLGIGIGIMVSMALSRAIVRPIRYLTDVAEKVSLGDTDLTVARQTNDEIGDLAESFGRLVASVKIMRTAMGDDEQL